MKIIKILGPVLLPLELSISGKIKHAASNLCLILLKQIFFQVTNLLIILLVPNNNNNSNNNNYVIISRIIR